MSPASRPSSGVQIPGYSEGTLREPWNLLTPSDATLSLEDYRLKLQPTGAKTIPKRSTKVWKDRAWLVSTSDDVCPDIELWIKTNTSFQKALLFGGYVSCRTQSAAPAVYLLCSNSCEGGSEYLQVYRSPDDGESWRAWQPVQMPYYRVESEKAEILPDGELQVTWVLDTDSFATSETLPKLVSHFVARSKDQGLHWTSNFIPPYFKDAHAR